MVKKGPLIVLLDRIEGSSVEEHCEDDDHDDEEEEREHDDGDVRHDLDAAVAHLFQFSMIKTAQQKTVCNVSHSHLHDRGPHAAATAAVVAVVIVAAADAASSGVAYGLLDVQRVLEKGIDRRVILGCACTYQMLVIASHFDGLCLRQHSIISVVDLPQVNNTCTRARGAPGEE